MKMKAVLHTKLKSIPGKLTPASSVVLRDYALKFVSAEINIFRFFSYGSNMNEGKFLRDTKRCGHEFGLRNVEPRILRNYERVLGNASKNHGLAFTICPSEGQHVEGICHDVPGEGLEAFLRKEGLILKEPTYELISVPVSGEQQPVLTLKGLKPSNLETLDCRSKLKVLHYVSTTIEGAERWGVDFSDMRKLRDLLERELCG